MTGNLFWPAPTDIGSQGFSAMSLARSWEAANGRLPPEVGDLLDTSPDRTLHGLELLFAVPEYQVQLPGGERPTQTDLFALLANAAGLAVLAVEGKVDETFGPTVEAKKAEGAEARLTFLHELPELDPLTTSSLRYQLVHRTAAAVILAQRFHPRAAVLVVHSFGPHDRWLEDFERFSSLLGAKAAKARLAQVRDRGGVGLFLGWVSGDQRFRQDLTGTAV